MELKKFQTNISIWWKPIVYRLQFSIVFTIIFILGYIIFKIYNLESEQILDKFAVKYDDFWSRDTLWRLITMNFASWNNVVFFGILLLFPGLYIFNWLYGNRLTFCVYTILALIVALLQYIIMYKLLDISDFIDAAPSNMLHGIITLLCLLNIRKKLFLLVLIILTFYNLFDMYLETYHNVGSRSALSHFIGQAVALVLYPLLGRYFIQSINKI